MFTQMSIPYYDTIYSSQGKDYRKEAAYLMHAIAGYDIPAHAELLDVACGTGMHLRTLKTHFRAEGLDVNPHFLKIAKKNTARRAVVSAGKMARGKGLDDGRE